MPPSSPLLAQKLPTFGVGGQASVWSVAEKSPGEVLFYGIELKNLLLLYNGIIIILLSELQRSLVE